MKDAMKNWKTTLGGLVSGLAAIFGGIAYIQATKDYEKGSIAIVGGCGLIWKGWHGVDVQSLPKP